MARYYQGRYKPEHPEKYLGDVSNIVYRSGYEFKFFRYCDTHPNITGWVSEEIVIPYLSPIDGRWHRYFPDVYMELVDGEGKKRKLLVEIKPRHETQPPVPKTTKTGKPSRKFLTEVKTWGTNTAKWKQAEEYCRDRGWEFKLCTERELFGP